MLCPLAGVVFSIGATVVLGLIITFAASASGGAWRGNAAVVIDWSKMPVSAAGDQRGVGSAIMRGMFGKAESLKDSSIGRSSLVKSGALTPQQLASQLTITVHDSGDTQSISIFARGRTKAEALTIATESQSRIIEAFNGYRLMEGVGVRMGDIDRSQRDRAFSEAQQANRMFSMLAAQPVTAPQPATAPVAAGIALIMVPVGLLMAVFGAGLGLIAAWVIAARMKRRQMLS